MPYIENAKRKEERTSTDDIRVKDKKIYSGVQKELPLVFDIMVLLNTMNIESFIYI